MIKMSFIKERERILKSVLTADSIETRRSWTLSSKENPLLCYYCKSPLFYIEIVHGIIDETNFYKEIKVLGKEREPQYYIREAGFNLFCAECGNFEEHYDKWFYPEDKLVCSWNDEEIDLAEIEEIKHCLEQFNRKGDFTPNYISKEMIYLKKKLREYEEKLKVNKKPNKKKTK